MGHEIAAAWIVGGFIMVFKPNAKWNEWVIGIIIIAIGTMSGMIH